MNGLLQASQKGFTEDLKFCPNCRCDLAKYLQFVGTVTTWETSGKGSLQERESYYRLYGDLIFEVKHYTHGQVIRCES